MASIYVATMNMDLDSNANHQYVNSNEITMTVRQSSKIRRIEIFATVSRLPVITISCQRWYGDIAVMLWSRCIILINLFIHEFCRSRISNYYLLEIVIKNCVNILSL